MGESYTDRLIYIYDWQAGVTPFVYNWWSKSSYYCWYCSNCWSNIRQFLRCFFRRLTYICLSLSFCCPDLHSKVHFLRSSSEWEGNKNLPSRAHLGKVQSWTKPQGRHLAYIKRNACFHGPSSCDQERQNKPKCEGRRFWGWAWFKEPEPLSNNGCGVE